MTSLQSTSVVRTQVSEQKTSNNPVTTSSSSQQESCCCSCFKALFSCCFTTPNPSKKIRVKSKQQTEYLPPVSIAEEEPEIPSKLLSSLRRDSQHLVRSQSQNKDCQSPPPSPRSTPYRQVITTHNNHRNSTPTTSSNSPESISLSIQTTPSSTSQKS